MPGPVEELFSKIFIRNKKPFQNKVRAVLLYFSGLSYRKARKFLGNKIRLLLHMDSKRFGEERNNSPACE